MNTTLSSTIMNTTLSIRSKQFGGAVGTIIGLISLAFEIVTIATHFLPHPQSHNDEDTVLMIGIGQSGTPDEQRKISMTGKQPAVILVDSSGKRIGLWTPGKHDYLGDGARRFVVVEHVKEMRGVPAEYVGLTKVDDDAICVQFVTMAWASGEKWAWLAETARACGADWHYSDISVIGHPDGPEVGSFPGKRPNYCIWLDRNHSNGLRHVGVAFHIRDFWTTAEKAKQYTEMPKTICKSKPRMHLYSHLNTGHWLPVFSPPLVYEEDTLLDANIPQVLTDGVVWDPKYQRPYKAKTWGGLSKQDEAALPEKFQHKPIYKQEYDGRMPYRKRSAGKTANISNGTFIQSRNEFHSARELCSSETSKGADLVSLTEKLYCDMEAKQLWPLCAYPLDFDCFDLVAGTMREGPRLRRRDGYENIPVPIKAYHNRLYWGENKISP